VRSKILPDQFFALLCTGFLLAMPQPTMAETVRFAHCFAGCPTGAPADNHVIARSIYTLSFNSDTRIADWAAYTVTAGSIGVATNLSRAPLVDPFVTSMLDPGEFPAAGEGNHLILDYLVPLVSFAGTPFWSEANFLTNRVPRNSELNRGSWYGLEWAVRNLANRTASLYVVTGPLFAETVQLSTAAAAGAVPSGFFKVVVDEGGHMAAFLFPQELPFHVHHCEQLTSVAEIEQMSGLDLFPELTQAPLEDLSEKLGCFRP
jgi:endonuclease G